MPQEHNLTLPLRDLNTGQAEPAAGEVRLELTKDAVLIYVKGYGNAVMEDGKGHVAAIAIESGEPVIRVWADKTRAFATHVVSLEGAKE